jgi:hypothetical protein
MAGESPKPAFSAGVVLPVLHAELFYRESRSMLLIYTIRDVLKGHIF